MRARLVPRKAKPALTRQARVIAAIKGGAVSDEEIAARANIPAATCGRIIADLVEKREVATVTFCGQTRYVIPHARPVRKKVRGVSKRSPDEHSFRERVVDGPMDRGTEEMRALRKATFGSPAARGELSRPLDLLYLELGPELVLVGQRVELAYARHGMAHLPTHLWQSWWQDLEYEPGEVHTSYEKLEEAVLRNVRRRFYGDPGVDRVARQAWEDIRRVVLGEWPLNVATLKIGLEAAARHFMLYRRAIFSVTEVAHV